MTPEVWTIIVAAGSGDRFGGLKQFEQLAGETVLDHSLRAARAVSSGVVVVVPQDPSGGDKGDMDPARGVAVRTDIDRTVIGGPTRSSSVRAGLAAVPAGAEVILVHDAARPMASEALFARVVAAVSAGADAVTPVLPLTDTIRRVGGGVVDRSELLAVQTPQGFRADALRRAHDPGHDATDDVALVEANGGKVMTVTGERTNIKITDRSDLILAEAWLAAR